MMFLKTLKIPLISLVFQRQKKKLLLGFELNMIVKQYIIVSKKK